jgi:hypothetical protein
MTFPARLASLASQSSTTSLICATWSNVSRSGTVMSSSRSILRNSTVTRDGLSTGCRRHPSIPRRNPKVCVSGETASTQLPIQPSLWGLCFPAPTTSHSTPTLPVCRVIKPIGVGGSFSTLSARLPSVTPVLESRKRSASTCASSPSLISMTTSGAKMRHLAHLLSGSFSQPYASTEPDHRHQPGTCYVMMSES